MSRTMIVEVKVKLVIDADEGIELSDIISEMDYSFQAVNDGQAEIMDSEILDYDCVDSR